MTTESPDPRSFKTWDDAFQYAVPVVRKLEHQLRANANDNREKLRTLAGASYRELLGTAERIIEMEGNMQQMETTLGKVGQRCNSRVVDRISSNHAKLDKHWRALDQERYAFASQLAVLQSCPNVIERLLRKRMSSLLVAKVLVISRLLHKALSQSKNKPPFVDHLRDQFGSLRRRLLARIDKQLSSSNADASVLVENMCAFSLATSSTPSDVLRHFHHIRMETIAEFLGKRENVQENILKALRLLVKTLQDTQTIFPRRLADSLAKLKSHPLIQDPDIQAITELNLDIHERWIAYEARNYTPQPRHDELQKTEAEKFLRSWAKQAIFSFLKGMKTVLSNVQDLRAVALLRKELLQTWLASSSKVPGLKSSAVLDDLRDAMNDRLCSIVRIRAQGLHTITLTISNILETFPSQDSEPNNSIWTGTTTFMDTSNGAESFKRAIINQSHGRSDSVLRIISIYEHWAESVREVKSIIKEMKELRWEDDFGDDENDLDNDDFGIDSIQLLLSNDDPRSLDEALQDALSDALTDLRQDLKTSIGQLASDSRNPSLPRAIFLLRVLREVGERLPTVYAKDSGSRLGSGSLSLSRPFDSTLIEPLHYILADAALQPALKSYKSSLQKLTRSNHASGHMLWESVPPLPAQPSPGTFRFLYTLIKEMGARGDDLWAPGAVRVLKNVGGKEVNELLVDCVETIMAQYGISHTNPPNDNANGTTTTPDMPGEETGQQKARPTSQSGLNSEVQKIKLTQLVFDALYLQRCLSLSSSHNSFPSDANLEKLVERLCKAADIDETGQARFHKSVAEYWKRTYMLFALL
ncbi:hypothetical protein K432DRAFT_334748, partial [Lepidopterella palustris CBS 459.81]